ncbi:hypothetical protein B0O99DRAFT_692951 [Bisporella sp. PMI_857]|nr:hypothetical protein B0O99DRAFT_692951 [Bisporella sp. PMI_857]
MLAQLILLALSIWAYKSILLFAFENHLFDFFDAVRKTNVFPNGDHLAPHLTGVAFLDIRLKNVIIFVWPFVTGNRPDLFLVEVGFFGAFGSGWFLIVLESVRAGSRGTLASHILLPGILIFEHSHAIMTPLYLIFHLSTSHVASNPTVNSIRVSLIDAQAMVGSFMVGYVLPMAAQALPSPAVLSLRQKQTLIGWYQQWHIYIYVCHVIFATLITLSGKNEEDGIGSQERSTYQSIYTFAFLLAAVPYWTVVSLSMLSTLFPTIFSKWMKPVSVFGLAWPLSEIRASSLDDALKWLLQWDFIVSSLAILCWSISLFLRARSTLELETDLPSLLFRIAISSILASPTGAAVQLMWERDDMIFGLESHI